MLLITKLEKMVDSLKSLLCRLLLAAVCLFTVANATYCSAPPSLSHGWHNGGKYYYKIGHVIEYSCEWGFWLKGSGTIRCSYGWRNGVKVAYWKGSLPRCVKGDSGDSSSSDSDNDSSYSNSGSNSHSNSGYYSESSESHSYENSNSGSSGSNSKSGPPPIKHCPKPKPPENGKVEDMGYDPGMFARYSCHYGYVHTGSLYRTCQHDGTWSGQRPKCISKWRVEMVCGPSYVHMGRASRERGGYT